MLEKKTIGLIGSGNMAQALVAGLLGGRHVSKEQVLASDHTQKKIDFLSKGFRIRTSLDNRFVAKSADVVVLAVKPQIVPRVLKEISKDITSKKLVLSIAAGVTSATIEGLLPKGTRVVRIMPNIAALVGAGASALAKGSHATDADLAAARAIFDAVGKTVVVEETQLDAVTGLSGSGPAYIFLVIDALADAGVKVGLSRDTSLTLAAQTVLGAAKLLIETGEHPGRLKDMVTSPGGTAIAGIHTLEEGGLRTTLINAVERATQRSKELGS